MLASEIDDAVADITYVAATGYGRRKFERADIVYPEVICHAAGAASIPFEGPLVLMGGVARCAAAKPILEEMLEMEVLVPEVPQMPASLGAAIMGRDEYFASL